MVEPQTSRFWQTLQQSGLVEESALRKSWDQIPPERRTVDGVDRRLARNLVQNGDLTLWQAQQLVAGLRPSALRYGKYVIIDLIGQGGMGRVYLAMDTRLGRRVVLKVLSRERMNNPRALTRFRREAKVGAQLQHENLVRIYDEGEANGNRFIVMEFIEGKTVGGLVADHGPMQPGLAARITRQVALGLAHADAKGLIHRDVNPMNVLIDRDGTAKLTDLGLAIDLGEQGDGVTREGATVGTFDYISPEQARHSRSIDIRSDIYSLGCTFYHMLAGRVPFPQPSLPEKLYAHQALEPQSLSEIVSGLPAGMEAIVGRMMAKNPEDRFETPTQVAEALLAYQSDALSLTEIESAPEVPVWIDPSTPEEQEAEAGAGAGGGATAESAEKGILADSGQMPVLTEATVVDTGPKPVGSGAGSKPGGSAGPVTRPPPDEDVTVKPPIWPVPSRVMGGAALAVAVLAMLAVLFWPSPRDSEAVDTPGEGVVAAECSRRSWSRSPRRRRRLIRFCGWRNRNSSRSRTLRRGYARRSIRTRRCGSGTIRRCNSGRRRAFSSTPGPAGGAGGSGSAAGLEGKAG